MESHNVLLKERQDAWSLEMLEALRESEDEVAWSEESVHLLKSGELSQGQENQRHNIASAQCAVEALPLSVELADLE